MPVKNFEKTSGGLNLRYEIPLYSEVVKKITSTDNSVARFDGTQGELQTSRLSVSDTGVLTCTASSSVYNKFSLTYNYLSYAIRENSTTNNVTLRFPIRNSFNEYLPISVTLNGTEHFASSTGTVDLGNIESVGIIDLR